MVGHPVLSPEMQAVAGWPITKLGEDSRGLEDVTNININAIPGTMNHPESVPSGVSRGMQILTRLAPASMERMNVNIQTQCAAGRKIIEEAGGIEAYDRKAREKVKILAPAMELSDEEALVFKE